jgi:hypothetical protein
LALPRILFKGCFKGVLLSTASRGSLDEPQPEERPGLQSTFGKAISAVKSAGAVFEELGLKFHEKVIQAQAVNVPQECLDAAARCGPDRRRLSTHSSYFFLAANLCVCVLALAIAS